MSQFHVRLCSPCASYRRDSGILLTVIYNTTVNGWRDLCAFLSIFSGRTGVFRTRVTFSVSQASCWKSISLARVLVVLIRFHCSRLPCFEVKWSQRSDSFVHQRVLIWMDTAHCTLGLTGLDSEPSSSRGSENIHNSVTLGIGQLFGLRATTMITMMQSPTCYFDYNHHRHFMSVLSTAIDCVFRKLSLKRISYLLW